MGRYYNPDDFIIQYPGVYEGAAKVAMDKYFADLKYINDTLVTGEDVIAGRVKEPKLGAELKVSANMMRYCVGKYAPGYAPMLDTDTAKAYGFEDIYAMVSFSACDDVFTMPTPPEARDTILVSQICHDMKSLRPIYPGDTLYMVRDRVEVTDLTPEEGSLYRHMRQKNYGTVYNQKGLAVATVLFTLMESVKLYKEGRMPKPKEKMGFMDMWEDPDWFSRPEHIYTEEDYDYFRSLWAAEPTPGDTPVYWEDLSVGYRFPAGLYGPIFEGVTPTKPYAMAIGGCRTLKEENLDPELRKTLVKDERTGIYKAADPDVNVPPTPDNVKPFWLAPPDEDAPASGEIDTADIHKVTDTRGALLNLMGRDIALGYITNCLGYHARPRRVRWSIMPADTHAALGKPVPTLDSYVHFVRQVPGMENVTQTIHGLTNDVAIIKTCVVDKYVENTDHIAKIVFWLEDIEGRCWFNGEVEAVLPAKK